MIVRKYCNPAVYIEAVVHGTMEQTQEEALKLSRLQDYQREEEGLWRHVGRGRPFQKIRTLFRLLFVLDLPDLCVVSEILTSHF